MVFLGGNFHRNRLVWWTLTLVVGFGWQAATSRAVLIATDHFLGGVPGDPLLGEYDLTTFKNQLRRGEANGGGQNPTVSGFVDPWSGNVTSGSLGVAQWTAEVGGLTERLPFHQGGRARYGGSTAVENLQRRVQRQLDTYTPNDTYYFSVSSQVLTDDLDLDGFVGIGFTNTGSGSTSAEIIASADANIVGGSGLRGFLVGAAGDGVEGTDYVIRHVGSTGSVQNDILLNNIEQNDPVSGSPFTRLTIVKLEFNDDPGNVNGNSKLTVWQDPAFFHSETAATASTTPLEFRTFALDTNADITHLTFTGVDYTRAASFDEPRLATTWEDAVPLPPGDFNLDGTVNLADYAVWRDNLGGAFTAADYNVWKANFTTPALGQVQAGGTAVPEPSAGMLLLGLLAASAVRHCRT